MSSTAGKLCYVLHSYALSSVRLLNWTWIDVARLQQCHCTYLVLNSFLDVSFAWGLVHKIYG